MTAVEQTRVSPQSAMAIAAQVVSAVWAEQGWDGPDDPARMVSQWLGDRTEAGDDHPEADLIVALVDLAAGLASSVEHHAPSEREIAFSRWSGGNGRRQRILGTPTSL